MNAKRERRPKPDARRESRLARIQPELETYTVSPVELRRMHTVCFDTADARLARYGCSLSFRHGEGWTFKIPVPRELNVAGSDAHQFAGGGNVIPAAALDLGTAYFRGDVPARVAELRTVRTSRHVITAAGSVERASSIDFAALPSSLRTARPMRCSTISTGCCAARTPMRHPCANSRATPNGTRFRSMRDRGELAATANAAARQGRERWGPAWSAAKRCRRTVRESLRP